MRQDLDYFYSVTETVHDGLGAADCVGSGYLVRRDALMDIGGFPAFSISEDTACSSLLLGKGWQVAYVDEYMQCGEMPETLRGHIKQRTRWVSGWHASILSVDLLTILCNRRLAMFRLRSR